ncbi:MAG: 4Fe-4S dicluster domain-containing protein [Desulfosalsimonadaceae bacterium]
MENSRRNFLKIAGYSILGVGAGSMLVGITPKFTTAASEESAPPKYKDRPGALKANRWGMVIDTRKINSRINKKMQQVCHKIHNVPDFVGQLGAENHEIKWIWPTTFSHAFIEQDHQFVSDRLKETKIPVLCNHCNNPPCVRACPTQATFKREKDGLVLMDFHRCIGCRFCIAACPYGSRSFNYRDPREAIEELEPNFTPRMKGVVEKCNFCAERLARGEAPACVEASEGALIFGDLEDPSSDIRKVLAEHNAITRKAELGTYPSVFYII